MNDDDKVMREWLKKGNQGVDKRLIERYMYGVVQAAYYFLTSGNPTYGYAIEDAKDVTQEVFVRAVKYIDKYDPKKASIRTWLQTITKNLCKNKIRQDKLEKKIRSLLGISEDTPDQGPSGAQWETDEQLLKAIYELPPKQREVIILRYWRGHTFKEIGIIEKCPLGTALSRHHAGLTNLRSALKKSDSVTISAPILTKK